MDQTSHFYSRPSYAFRGGAGGFHVFSGSRRQRGGSFLGALKKFFFPIAKSLGRQLLSQGVGLASELANDAMSGKNLKDAIKTRGKASAINFGKSAARQGIGALTSMIGKGGRRAPRRRRKGARRGITKRRKSRATPRRQRQRATSRKPVSRKRRSRSKSSHRRKAKRRRVNF